MNDNEVDHLATPAEAVDEWRHNVGPDRAEEAWLLHDRDVWVRNPNYAGPPVPHPEDEQYDFAAEQAMSEDAAREDARNPYDEEGALEAHDDWMPRNLDIADECPF